MELINYQPSHILLPKNLEKDFSDARWKYARESKKTRAMTTILCFMMFFLT